MLIRPINEELGRVVTIVEDDDTALDGFHIRSSGVNSGVIAPSIYSNYVTNPSPYQKFQRRFSDPPRAPESDACGVVHSLLLSTPLLDISPRNFHSRLEQHAHHRMQSSCSSLPANFPVFNGKEQDFEASFGNCFSNKLSRCSSNSSDNTDDNNNDNNASVMTMANGWRI
mmetsp:Transcript_12323/g.22092  ORF Transcript_12323/g.22092 Transcript_12323/m.22092 type:complete len:170 (-) Transcript_12323:232-741(-)